MLQPNFAAASIASNLTAFVGQQFLKVNVDKTEVNAYKQVLIWMQKLTAVLRKPEGHENNYYALITTLHEQQRRVCVVIPTKQTNCR